jgi:hypothetical protein
MSAGTNSVPPFLGGTTKDALEALGITQFPSETEWYQVIGGLIVQGGLVEIEDGALAVVEYSAPYEKQILGLWIQVVGGTENGAVITAPLALDSFSITNGTGDRGYYWLSLGV